MSSAVSSNPLSLRSLKKISKFRTKKKSSTDVTLRQKAKYELNEEDIRIIHDIGEKEYVKPKNTLETLSETESDTGSDSYVSSHDGSTTDESFAFTDDLTVVDYAWYDCSGNGKNQKRKDSSSWYSSRTPRSIVGDAEDSSVGDVPSSYSTEYLCRSRRYRSNELKSQNKKCNSPSVHNKSSFEESVPALSKASLSIHSHVTGDSQKSATEDRHSGYEDDDRYSIVPESEIAATTTAGKSCCYICCPFDNDDVLIDEDGLSYYSEQRRFQTSVISGQENNLPPTKSGWACFTCGNNDQVLQQTQTFDRDADSFYSKQTGHQNSVISRNEKSTTANSPCCGCFTCGGDDPVWDAESLYSKQTGYQNSVISRNEISTTANSPCCGCFTCGGDDPVLHDVRDTDSYYSDQMCDQDTGVEVGIDSDYDSQHSGRKTYQSSIASFHSDSRDRLVDEGSETDSDSRRSGSYQGSIVSNDTQTFDRDAASYHSHENNKERKVMEDANSCPMSGDSQTTEDFPRSNSISKGNGNENCEEDGDSYRSGSYHGSMVSHKDESTTEDATGCACFGCGNDNSTLEDAQTFDRDAASYHSDQNNRKSTMAGERSGLVRFSFDGAEDGDISRNNSILPEDQKRATTAEEDHPRSCFSGCHSDPIPKESSKVSEDGRGCHSEKDTMATPTVVAQVSKDSHRKRNKSKINSNIKRKKFRDLKSLVDDELDDDDDDDLSFPRDIGIRDNNKRIHAFERKRSNQSNKEGRDPVIDTRIENDIAIEDEPMSCGFACGEKSRASDKNTIHSVETSDELGGKSSESDNKAFQFRNRIHRSRSKDLILANRKDHSDSSIESTKLEDESAPFDEKARGGQKAGKTIKSWTGPKELPFDEISDIGITQNMKPSSLSSVPTLKEKSNTPPKTSTFTKDNKVPSTDIGTSKKKKGSSSSKRKTSMPPIKERAKVQPQTSKPPEEKTSFSFFSMFDIFSNTVESQESDATVVTNETLPESVSRYHDDYSAAMHDLVFGSPSNTDPWWWCCCPNTTVDTSVAITPKDDKKDEIDPILNTTVETGAEKGIASATRKTGKRKKKNKKRNRSPKVALN